MATYTLKLTPRTLANLRQLTCSNSQAVDITTLEERSVSFEGTARYAVKTPQTMDELEITFDVPPVGLDVFRTNMPQLDDEPVPAARKAPEHSASELH